MNIVAIDIGNTNISVGLFLEGKEDFIKSVGGSSEAELSEILAEAWEKIPIAQCSTERKRNGFIAACSVKPAWTDMVRRICREKLGEKVKVIGQDIPLPIETGVDNPFEVGTDRLVAGAAAFAVVEDAVVVADFGTAVTIDLVDEQGVFMGGVICPGFEMAAESLHKGTAQLPKVAISVPKGTYGANTVDAVNNGIFYSAVGLLETITRKYAEELGHWPQVIVTGGGAKILRQSCEFVDSWVPNLVLRGVVLAFMKSIESSDAE